MAWDILELEQQMRAEVSIEQAFCLADLCSLCPSDQSLANVASGEAAWCLDIIPVFLRERVGSAL